jgi:hypothetical protein
MAKIATLSGVDAVFRHEFVSVGNFQFFLFFITVAFLVRRADVLRLHVFSKESRRQCTTSATCVVLAGPNIPAVVLAGVGDRVNKAINATVRTEVYPRVVLTIRVLSVQNDQGYDKKHSVAKVTVDAASVDDGTVIAVSSFEVNSKSNSADAADEILAEDISARIRSIFSLNAGHA